MNTLFVEHVNRFDCFVLIFMCGFIQALGSLQVLSSDRDSVSRGVMLVSEHQGVCSLFIGDENIDEITLKCSANRRDFVHPARYGDHLRAVPVIFQR